jgi:hypothetical protein
MWAKKGGSPSKRGTLRLVIHRARLEKTHVNKILTLNGEGGVKLKKTINFGGN